MQSNFFSWIWQRSIWRSSIGDFGPSFSSPICFLPPSQHSLENFGGGSKARVPSLDCQSEQKWEVLLLLHPTPPCRTTTRGETSCEAFEFVFLVVPREVKWKFGYDAKRDSGPAHPWWREWYDEHNFTKEAYWNYFQYHCEAAVSLVSMKLSPLKLDSPFVSR